MLRNHYEVLGVDLEAIPSEIEAAYENMGGSNGSSEIQEAYRVLSNVSERKEYNEHVVISDYSQMQARYNQCAHFNLKSYNDFLKIMRGLSQYSAYIHMRNFIDIYTNNAVFKQRQKKLKTEEAKNLHIDYQRAEEEIINQLKQLNIAATNATLNPVPISEIIKLEENDLKKLEKLIFDEYKIGLNSFNVKYNAACLPFYERLKEFFKSTKKNIDSIKAMYDSFDKIDQFTHSSSYFSDYNLIKAIESYIKIAKHTSYTPAITKGIEYAAKINAFYLQWYVSIDYTNEYKISSHVEHHIKFLKNVHLLKTEILKKMELNPIFKNEMLVGIEVLNQLLIESANFITNLKNYIPAILVTEANALIQAPKPKAQVVNKPLIPEVKNEPQLELVPVEHPASFNANSNLYKSIVSSINHLDVYIQRIELHKRAGKIDFKHGFCIFNRNKRARSRAANYQLAVNLRDTMLQHKESYETGYTVGLNEQIQNLVNPVTLSGLRQSLWTKPGSINRKINSQQLNDAIEFIQTAPKV